MWWGNLSSFEQISFIVAISASAVLLLFVIMMLVGAANEVGFDGGDGDVDITVDINSDDPFSNIGGLKIFTFRSLLVFFCIGGWTSFLFGGIDGLHEIWALVIGCTIGAVAAILAAIVFKSMYKLESSGNISYKYGIGTEATVYLNIGKNLSKAGKVNATIQEKFLEVSAITPDDEDLKVGQRVYIIGVADETTVIVSKNKKQGE